MTTKEETTMKKLIAVIGIVTFILSLAAFFNKPSQFNREKYIASVCLEMAADAQKFAAAGDTITADIITKTIFEIETGLRIESPDIILPDIYLKQGVSR